MKGILFIFLSLALLARGASAADRKLFTIGLIAPISGPMSSIGASIQAGIQYGLKEMHSSVILRTEDDQFQPKLTVSAMRRLVDVEKVDAIIVFGSPTSLSIVEELERKKVPTISIAIHPEITKNKRYVFRVFPSSVELAEVTAQEATKRGYSAIAMVTHLTDGLLSISSRFLTSFPKEKIISYQEVSPTETDLRPYVAKLLKGRPDAVYLMLLPHHLTPFIQQLMSFKYEGPIFNAVSMANTSVLRQIRPIVKNGWFVMIDVQKVKPTIDSIEREYGIEFETEGLNGYEAVKLLLSVLDEPDIAKALREKKEFESLQGIVNPRGQDYFIPVSVNQLSN